MKPWTEWCPVSVLWPVFLVMWPVAAFKSRARRQEVSRALWFVIRHGDMSVKQATDHLAALAAAHPSATVDP